MWKCEKCGVELEDQFDSCWNCGTGQDAVVPPRSECELRPREGSVVLGFCTFFALVSVFISLGFGFYLFWEGSLLYGLLVGGVGAVYHSGLFLVFCEVNRLLGERKAENTKETEACNPVR